MRNAFNRQVAKQKKEMEQAKRRELILLFLEFLFFVTLRFCG